MVLASNNKLALPPFADIKSASGRHISIDSEVRTVVLDHYNKKKIESESSASCRAFYFKMRIRCSSTRNPLSTQSSSSRLISTQTQTQTQTQTNEPQVLLWQTGDVALIKNKFKSIWQGLITSHLDH